ncbi:uncharacterized protein LOC126080879 isoform X2 [Elephas maximus indicus]|uniref:uncharacterized protein LOC126080879 isoform X2 n=2 Tax=Elephas maximus indicus TaxID=99487 RepID=UPI002116BBAC|nr:uncharacterized protein LOC126080879 isoform X2 [Elephas maximus indicus]
MRKWTLLQGGQARSSETKSQIKFPEGLQIEDRSSCRWWSRLPELLNLLASVSTCTVGSQVFIVKSAHQNRLLSRHLGSTSGCPLLSGAIILPRSICKSGMSFLFFSQLIIRDSSCGHRGTLRDRREKTSPLQGRLARNQHIFGPKILALRSSLNQESQTERESCSTECSEKCGRDRAAGNSGTFSAAVRAVQGVQQTTTRADSGIPKVGQPAALHSDLWKRMPVKKILGVVQILIGLINLTLGITMMSVSLPSDGPKPISVYTGYTLWGSVVFIVSGAWLIAEDKTAGYTNTYLRLNSITSIVAIIGIVISVLSLIFFSFYYFLCDQSSMPEKCAMNYFMLMGMDGVVLTLSVLEFFINVSLCGLSLFWWRWWRWRRWRLRL